MLDARLAAGHRLINRGYWVEVLSASYSTHSDGQADHVDRDASRGWFQPYSRTRITLFFVQSFGDHGPRGKQVFVRGVVGDSVRRQAGDFFLCHCFQNRRRTFHHLIILAHALLVDALEEFQGIEQQGAGRGDQKAHEGNEPVDS